jgi:hypothetical protein
MAPMHSTCQAIPIGRCVDTLDMAKVTTGQKLEQPSSLKQAPSPGEGVEQTI